VDHPTVLSRLEAQFGVSGMALLLWFRSYIANRSQAVSISGVTSSSTPLHIGVPQGSVLGLLYNSPLHSIIRQHGLSAHYFADDTQIYTEFEISKDGADQIKAYRRIKCCTEDTNSWMFENKLKLNEDKSDALLVSSSHPSKKPLPLPLSIGDEKILPAGSVRNLGMILDSHLTLEVHVNKVCRLANYQLHQIGRVRKCFDDATFAILVSSLVFPYLDYDTHFFMVSLRI
jgi:hypothetical protein